MGKPMRKLKQWWTGIYREDEKRNNSGEKITSRAGAKAFSYTHRAGAAQNVSAGGQSPVLPLYSPGQLDNAAKELRGILARDTSPECQQALDGEMGIKMRSLCKHWYQRIDYPQHGIASTSDRSKVYVDEGSLNRLGKRLSSEEACALRPWPKWYYIKPVLPPISGKSVMEVGSSHGFFCFRFAELGAQKVTGVEIIRTQYESAVWSAKVLGHSNVEFLHTDFLLDMSIVPHDIVFLSEVHNHFLFPFYGLLRMVNLARELVIWDGEVRHSQQHGIALNTGWHDETGRLIYHSFHLSETLILDFLDLIGIPAAKVTRYRAPDEPNHVLFMINTADLAQERKARHYPEYLRQALALGFPEQR
jgi:SAM-dependent methyltransferase